MRVSSTQMVGRYQKQLNDSYEDQTRMMEQSDGSKLHRPSDDSVNYSKYLRYQNSSTENAQYQSNVKTGISWMKTADSAMVNMKDIMTTLKEKTIQAATDTEGEGDIKAIGKEFLAKVQELVSLGNTQQGDRYMFSGQSDLTQPFSISSNKYDRGLTKTLDDNQAAYFGDLADSNGNLTQMLTLEGMEGDVKKTYYMSTTTGLIYSRDFMDNDYKDRVADRQTKTDSEVTKDKDGHITAATVGSDALGKVDGWTWTAGATASDDSTKPTETVSKYFDANGVIKEAGENWSFTLDNGVKLTFSTVNQYIVTYQGDQKHISMVKRNGTTDPTADTVNATGQDLFGSGIFDNVNSGNQPKGAPSGAAALNDLLTVVAKMESADVRWLSSDGVAISDSAHAKMVDAQTTTAARQNVYDSVSTMLDNQNETITEDISNASDADVAKLAVMLMTMQTIYNMSLSVGSRILPQSLTDYLS